MHSCIFEGLLKHCRYTPIRHEFKYRLFMMYLDLSELEEVFRGRWLWSVKHPTLARFRRGDHAGDPEKPLEVCVRNLVEDRTGRRPIGPIRLLTQLSYLGYGFSPVSFYYCFDSTGEVVESIVTEVNNTPWGEQYCYVLSGRSEPVANEPRHFSLTKEFHVSPFMDMAVDYEWWFTDPAERLHVCMENHKDGDKFFEATMRLERSEINGYSLARLLVVYPLTTMRVVLVIYWQALRLWLKRSLVYDHPKNDTLVESKK
ncbi:MAG: DUF1365 domain-containing protein [Candidatus Rariloculaceae bacterium]